MSTNTFEIPPTKITNYFHSDPANKEKRKELYGADVDDIYGNELMDSELGLGRRRRKVKKNTRNRRIEMTRYVEEKGPK